MIEGKKRFFPAYRHILAVYEDGLIILIAK